MKRHIALILLVSSIAIPFLTNLLGWNIYAYLNFGDKDLILAAALGVSHNAWADHYEEDLASGFGIPNDFTTTIVDAGFLNLFLEPSGGQMTPFVFNFIEPNEFSDYRGFEFPWLLLLIFPAVILLLRKLKRRRNSMAQITDSPSSGQ